LASGPSVAHLGMNIEICGLETIGLSNTTALFYSFPKYSGTLDIERTNASDYIDHFVILGSTFCKISGYKVFEQDNNTLVYSLYSGSDISLDPLTGEVVISTSVSMNKTVLIQAFINSGPAVNYISF